MVVLISLLTIALVAYSIILFICWTIHISMVKGENCKYGWAGYKQFKNEFNKYTWDYDGMWRYSLFSYKTGGYLHASIFKFNHQGMIIRDPISYMLCVLRIRKQVLKINPNLKKNVVKW